MVAPTECRVTQEVLTEANTKSQPYKFNPNRQHAMVIP